MNLCDECGRNHATVHVTHIDGENTVVSHLCDECAKQKGISISITLGDPQGVEQALTSALEGELAAAKQLVCENCGMSFSEFKQHGRLGCEQCYIRFEKEIQAIIKQVHGSVVHRGKACPQKFPLSTDVKDISALRSELSVAVEREEFERAAALRDAIHALGGKPSLEEQPRSTNR